VNKQMDFWSLMIWVTLACGAFAQQQRSETQPPRRILDEIRSHRSGVAVWWTGHNGWLIKADDILIGTDLCLEQEDRQVPAPISAAELASELDISFITHEHGDHFERETSKILAEKSDCVFVMPINCITIARDEVGIPEHRLKAAIPKQPFSLNGAQITPLRAIHGNPKFAVFEEANLEDCGYLITLGGKSFLQPGDTVLLEDHLFLKHVDVLFFSPTEHNMHIDRSVILINELEPDLILPQHRDTFKVTRENRYWTSAYPFEVKLLLSKPLQQRYHVLEMGEKIIVR